MKTFCTSSDLVHTNYDLHVYITEKFIRYNACNTCTHRYTQRDIHTHTHTYTHTYTHKHTHMHKCTQTHRHMHTDTYIYTDTQVHTPMYVGTPDRHRHSKDTDRQR